MTIQSTIAPAGAATERKLDLLQLEDKIHQMRHMASILLALVEIAASDKEPIEVDGLEFSQIGFVAGRIDDISGDLYRTFHGKPWPASDLR